MVLQKSFLTGIIPQIPLPEKEKVEDLRLEAFEVRFEVSGSNFELNLDLVCQELPVTEIYQSTG